MPPQGKGDMDAIWGQWFQGRTVLHSSHMSWDRTPSTLKFNMTILLQIINSYHWINVMDYEMVNSCLGWCWHSCTRREGLIHITYPILKEGKIQRIKPPYFFIMQSDIMNFQWPLILMLYHLWKYQTSHFYPLLLQYYSSIYTTLISCFIYLSLYMLLSSISTTPLTSFMPLLVRASPCFIVLWHSSPSSTYSFPSSSSPHSSVRL